MVPPFEIYYHESTKVLKNEKIHQIKFRDFLIFVFS